jgi:sulfoxide reductase heme-binding subunit YedZ
VLHLTTYLVLDQGLDLSAIVADIVKRPYITIGMAAFTLLVPLALTQQLLDPLIGRESLGSPA